MNREHTKHSQFSPSMLFHSLQFTHFSFAYFIRLGRRRLCFLSASDFFYFTCRPVSHVHIQSESEVHELQPNRYTVTATCFRLSLVLFTAITAALLLLLLLLLLLFHFENRLFAKFQRVFFFFFSSLFDAPIFCASTTGDEQNMQKCVRSPDAVRVQWWFFLKCRLLKTLAASSHSILIICEVSCWQLRP